MRRWLFVTYLSILASVVPAQQGNLMFFANHYLPETHYLNPASTCPCETFVAIPLLSSIYFNYGNSAFSYTDLVGANNTYSTNTVDETIDKLGRRSYMGIDSRLLWLGVGHKFPNYYLNFSIREVLDVPTSLPREMFELVWMGNAPFEGEKVSAKGTGVYFHHYREYALGFTKPVDANTLFGIRAKILFGKLNVTTRGTQAELFTDEHTFNLSLTGDLQIRTSLPIEVSMSDDDPGLLDTIVLKDDTSISQLLFNRKNPGFAIDVGIIRDYENGVRLLASINDLGFIRYRSNLNTFRSTDEIAFQGVNFDTVQQQPVFSNIFTDTLRLEHSTGRYTFWLPPTLRLGLQYPLTPKIHPGIGLTAKWYNTKLLTTLHFNVDYQLRPALHLLAGYTLQYRSYNNIGLGLICGRGPVQFYAISDNLTGLIWPLNSQNINIRAGLNINLGCPRGSKTQPDNAQPFGQVPCPNIHPRQSKFKLKALRKRGEN